MEIKTDNTSSYILKITFRDEIYTYQRQIIHIETKIFTFKFKEANIYDRPLCLVSVSKQLKD